MRSVTGIYNPGLVFSSITRVEITKRGKRLYCTDYYKDGVIEGPYSISAASVREDVRAGYMKRVEDWLLLPEGL